MDNIYIIPVISSIFFIILTCIEEKYIKKEEQLNTKLIFRNSLLVFICVIFAIMSYEQLIPITNVLNTKSNEVFTTKPGF